MYNLQNIQRDDISIWRDKNGIKSYSNKEDFKIFYCQIIQKLENIQDAEPEDWLKIPPCHLLSVI